MKNHIIPIMLTTTLAMLSSLNTTMAQRPATNASTNRDKAPFDFLDPRQWFDEPEQTQSRSVEVMLSPNVG